MYRPGPMELIPVYCRRKAGKEPIEKVHPLVDGILAETMGIMVYQEQVMQVLNKLGGLPLSRALTLIKAISKKKEKVISAERPAFLEGAASNGIDTAESDRLFELIKKFADTVQQCPFDRCHRGVQTGVQIPHPASLPRADI
jgi:DNA polymerase-3 subunit alpha